MTFDQKQPCLRNISPKGKRVRLLLGSSGLVAVLGASVALVCMDVDPAWRWGLLLPTFASILCILEAKCSTCVILAALGAWDLGCGTQRVPDPGLESQLRQRAWKLVGWSALLAVGLCTLLSLIEACP